MENSFGQKEFKILHIIICNCAERMRYTRRLVSNYLINNIR